VLSRGNSKDLARRNRGLPSGFLDENEFFLNLGEAKWMSHCILLPQRKEEDEEELE